MVTAAATRTDIAHTYSAYAKGICRCEVCTDAWREYQARRRQRSAAPLEDFHEHRQHGHLVRLTSLGEGIARAAQARTGKALDDIVEAAIRQAGPLLEF